MAWVQMRLGRDEEALQHLAHASSMPMANAAVNRVTGAETNAHLQLALVHAGTRNPAAAGRAHAHKLNAGAGALADNAIIVAALTGKGRARAQHIAEFIRLAQNAAPAVRDANVHRMTGLTLLAEGKYVEAIKELRHGGPKSVCVARRHRGRRAMGKKQEADAEYAGHSARRYFSPNSSATPLVHYRTKVKPQVASSPRGPCDLPLAPVWTARGCARRASSNCGSRYASGKSGDSPAKSRCAPGMSECSTGKSRCAGGKSERSTV